MNPTADRARSNAPSSPELIGREAELRGLHSQLARAAAGSGGVVLIGGEAGIGKTTLVSQLMCDAQERGFLVLMGACYDLTMTPPYDPWVEAIQRYQPVDGLPSVPAWFQVREALATVGSQAALFEEVRQFLSGIAAHRPLMLVLEDLHWSDAASLELLRVVARSLDTNSLLLVVTYRIDELNREHPLFQLLPSLAREASARGIVLQRFDIAAVRSLIAAHFQLVPADEQRLATYLIEHSEGNPLYLRELLRALTEVGILVASNSGWIVGDLDRIVVPSLIHQLIEGRLDRIGSDARRLLTIAAVIGQNVPLDLWRDVSNASEDLIESVIERSVDANIFQESRDGSGYYFTHALIREVLYAGLVLTRKRHYHRLVGEALLRSISPDPVAVAHHFQQAADPRAAEWQLRAAEQAQSLYAPELAIELFTHALDSLGWLSIAQRIQAHRGRGYAHDTTGDYRSARLDHEAALDLARRECDRQAEWQALLDLGTVWASRDYELTGVYMRQALDLARGLDDPLALAKSLNWIGNWNVNIEQPVKAQSHHAEALAIYQQLGDRHGVAETCDFLGMATMLAGDLIQAADHYRRAIALLDELDERQRLSSSLINLRGTDGQFANMGSAPGLTVPEGHRASERALAIAREIGWRSGEAYGLAFLGVNLAAQGQYGPAVIAAQAGHDIAEEIGHQQWIAITLCILGLIHLECFAYGEACACLERSLSISKSIGALFISRCASGYLALAHIGQGTHDVAEALLERELDQAGDPPTVAQRIQWTAWIEVELARDQPENAAKIVDWLGGTIPTGSGRHVPINLHLLRGRALTDLRRWQEAETELHVARDGAIAQGAASWLVRIHLALGRLYQARARRVDAERELINASHIAQDLASSFPDDAVRERYLQQVTSQLERFSKPSTTGLSPREIEVLRLVAEGLTDAEVAIQLGLSPRTVSQHLRSIYNKLGVSGRTAATRLAVETHIV